MKKTLLYAEFFILYVATPLALLIFHDDLKNWLSGGSFIILFLPLIALILLFVMWRQKVIDKRKLFFVADFKKYFGQMLKLFLPFAVIISAFTCYFFPDLFLVFPKENPAIWLLVMFFYPLLSVLPQGIIYRVFFYKRYTALFRKQTLLLVASALSFCFCHIFFENIYALIFTFLGGFLFAFRYQQTGSWLMSSLEHALYGDLLFTIGLGYFLVS